MSNNIATMPLPTNAGPKPFIKLADSGYLSSLPGAGAFIGNTLSSTQSALEGNYVYALFKFQTSSTDTTLVELKDTVAVTYAFDGISADDWVPGTFKIATLNNVGQIDSDAQSDWYDAGYTAGTVASFGWAPVSTSNTASSGTVYYKDIKSFDPNAGTGVYGVILAVQVKQDTLTESGEHVLFKVTQDTASGSAFTQSNYTEARIKVADFVGSVTTYNGTAGGGARTFNAAGTPFLSGTEVTGTTGVPDIFDLEGSATNRSKSTLDNTSLYTAIGGFETTDVLKIGMTGTNPGLSITNFGDLSATILNEAYLVTGIRALDGTQMNVGGIYLMQVKDVGANIETQAATTSSTYVFVDTNRNGIADTNSSNDGVTGSDLLIKLTGVDVHSLQSTNFNLV